MTVSSQGKNLAALIIGGLVAGFAGSFVSLDGVPLTDYLIQTNWLVYRGWVWQLLTSLIIVLPNYLGVADVMLNAVAVIWLDRLLAATFGPAEYYSIFIISGLAGNLLSLINGPFFGSFGASGGIFGLLAGTVSADFAVERKVNYVLVGWFLMILILSSSLPSTDWLGHLGGAAFGLLAGYIIGARHRAVQVDSE